MNAGILPLGGPAKKASAPNYELMLRLADLSDALVDNTENTLLYDTVIFDQYAGYDTTTGFYTVPPGKGGLYLVQVGYLVGGASGGLVGLSDLSIYGTTYGRVFLSTITTTIFDGYIRDSRTGLIELHDGESAYLTSYLTDTQGPATWTPFNGFAGANQWVMYRI